MAKAVGLSGRSSQTRCWPSARTVGDERGEDVVIEPLVQPSAVLKYLAKDIWA